MSAEEKCWCYARIMLTQPAQTGMKNGSLKLTANFRFLLRSAIFDHGGDDDDNDDDDDVDNDDNDNDDGDGGGGGGGGGGLTANSHNIM
jgi:hypothetical protein